MLVQPGRGADLDAQPQGTVPLGHDQGPGVAQKNLARKVGAQTAMLQAADGYTAGKDGAFPLAGLAQLVGTTATVAIPIGIARATILAAYGSELSPVTIQISHAGRLPFSSPRSVHLKIGSYPPRDPGIDDYNRLGRGKQVGTAVCPGWGVMV